MVSNAGLITAPHFDLLEATKWKNHKSNKSLNREPFKELHFWTHDANFCF
ncbi:hypothetical protein BACCAP_02183 [Pseudoflavonifractor capillosus ATCC 29799]|uniref:Uncharacterized protein n=1 Tax=Pseudoflavonifractor capillosus ATCC 29799 TaxID=411467 RepID=A6NVE8_9FIRM|nr:hypothetical protein BACCAP_02183 [Pseudoflavonifractor capillosus ATCC 29799]